MVTRSAVALLALLAASHRATLAHEAEDGAFKIHMLSGAREYDSAASLKTFSSYLEQNHDVHCTVSLGEDGDRELPGIEALGEADVLLVFCRRLKLVPEQLAVVRRWCEAGRPVVGVRTASHAFQTWLAFDKLILGGDYKGHYGTEAVQIRVHQPNATHPVLSGVPERTRPGKLYRNPKLAEDVSLLLTGTSPSGSQPVAWVRVYDRERGARAFYTSMGIPADFRDAGFRTLLTNAVFWTAHHPLPSRTTD